MSKLKRKIERLEKEAIFLEKCLKEKKREIKKAKEIARSTPEADRRNFLR